VEKLPINRGKTPFSGEYSLLIIKENKCIYKLIERVPAHAVPAVTEKKIRKILSPKASPADEP